MDGRLGIDDTCLMVETNVESLRMALAMAGMRKPCHGEKTKQEQTW
jgi:hypothetical protein